jgi:hypothetical protein
LKRSIIKHGFSFPVFVWDGDKILDGHQRIYAVTRLMSEDGYTIDNIPVVDIEATDTAHAAEKLLLLNSKYGRMTERRLTDFAAAYGLDLESIAADLIIPDVDFGGLINDFEIEMIDGGGKMKSHNYGLEMLSGKIPISIIGVGGLCRREILQTVKEKLIESGATEGNDNGDILEQMFLYWINK